MSRTVTPLDFSSLQLRATDLLHAHRRTVSGVLAALGVVFAISAARPGQPASTGVWVAARTLHGGTALTPADVRLERLATADVPSGALGGDLSPVGRIVAAPMRQGEPLTDIRLLSRTLIDVDTPGALAVPVRVSDGPAALTLVKAGERISVIATNDPGTGAPARARTVVEDVRVLAVPDHLTDDDAGLVIVAVTRYQAALLAALPPGDRVSVAVRQ